jgi:geranylgeranyl diphosphate synthase type I
MRGRSGTSGTRAGGRQPHAKAISPNPFTALQSALRREIDARLTGLLDAKIDAARGHGRPVVEMLRALTDLCLRGGKRLRSSLVATGLRAADERIALDPAIDAGVAVELLHTYLLVHDDWMDGDLVRRGGPSVHAQLARRFRSNKIGDAAGILAGDYAAALAAEALSRVDVAPARLPRLLACFAQMQLDAVVGQQLDLLGSRDIETMYMLKTSSYTVRGPLQLGALLAGSSPRLATTLDRYAMPAGVAFQLRDDLLGVFGDPKLVGKPFGSDLKSGKRTLLLVEAERRARGPARSVLRRVVANPRASDVQLRRAVEVLESCGARAVIEARIENLGEQALLALKTGPITTAGRELLEGAIKALTSRQN